MSFMQRNQDAAAKKQGGARKVADDSAARILELETALAALSEEKRKADELLREKTENEADLRRKVEALSVGLGVRDAQIERLKKLLGRKGSAVSGDKSRPRPPQGNNHGASVLQQVDSLFWKKQSDFGTSGSSLPRTPHLPWQIGQNVQGEGIYFGVLDLHKNYGSPDEKAYYLFAAPVDLAGPDGRALSLTFEQAADEVSKLSNFFGHDGAFYDDDRALFADLKADRYGGGWVIPPLPFLNGAGAERGFQGDNLFNHRSVGAFDGTYTAKQEDGRMFYWSSSLWPHSSFFVANVDFASGDCDYFSRNRAALSVRVCRLVPVL